MEKIGDREAAIADRVRALLEAANSTAAAVAGTARPPEAWSALPQRRLRGVPAVWILDPATSQRLDPSLDPATVVANLTAAGIQLAVS